MKPSGELFLEKTQSRRLGVDVKKQTRRQRGREARPGGRAPLPRAFLVVCLSWVQVLWIMFVPKIMFPKVSFCLDSA